MLPTGNTFDNAKNCESITITSEKTSEASLNDRFNDENLVLIWMHPCICPRRHLKHQACCRLGTHLTTQKMQINHNNKRENMRRNNHQYKVCDKILVKRKKNSKHELEFMGPCPITQINDNGTVRFQKGIINDATNFCRIKPFFD